MISYSQTCPIAMQHYSRVALQKYNRIVVLVKKQWYNIVDTSSYLEETILEFDVVNRDNLYDTVAAAIEEKILSGEIKPGDKLPSENMLAQMFGVSRNVVRESLRVVKEWGLVEVKTGSGIYACKPKIGQISRNLNRMVLLNNILLDDFFDMRLLIETRACRLAAENITDKQLEILKETIVTMNTYADDSKEWGDAEDRFHCTIAKAAGNKFMYIFTASLIDAMRVYTEESLNGTYCKEIVHSHTGILEALKAHDACKAEKLMEKHISEACDWMKKTEQQNSRK